MDSRNGRKLDRNIPYTVQSKMKLLQPSGIQIENINIPA